METDRHIADFHLVPSIGNGYSQHEPIDGDHRRLDPIDAR